MNCPKCGATDGYYSHVKGYRHYSPEGKPIGEEITDETQYAYCYTCGARVLIKKLQENAPDVRL